jgi:hypothetical protein
LVSQPHFALRGLAWVGCRLRQHRRGAREIIGMVERNDILPEDIVWGVPQAVVHRGIGEATDVVCGQNQDDVSRLGDEGTGQTLAPDQRCVHRAISGTRVLYWSTMMLH